MKFSKFMVLLVFFTLYVFIGLVLYIFWTTGSEPVALIAMFGSIFSLELSALAVIKVKEGSKNDETTTDSEVNTEEVPINVIGFSDTYPDYDESEQ